MTNGLVLDLLTVKSSSILYQLSPDSHGDVRRRQYLVCANKLALFIEVIGLHLHVHKGIRWTLRINQKFEGPTFVGGLHGRPFKTLPDCMTD